MDSVLSPEVLKSGPLLAVKADVLTLVFAYGAVFREVGHLEKLSSTGDTDR